VTAGEIAVEAVGWAGALLTLAAYALVSARRVELDSVLYQSLNIAGAAGFIVHGLVHGPMRSAAVNMVWTGIGVYALARRAA
jgi:hypothetical protein